MEKSSKKMNYENAAIMRDRIKALTQIQSSQKINTTNLNNADVISISQEAAKSCIQVFFYRSKQNWGNQSFFPTHDESHTAEEVLTSFIMQFYENKNAPSEILVNKKIKNLNLVKLALESCKNVFVVMKILLCETQVPKTYSVIVIINEDKSEYYYHHNTHTLITNTYLKFLYVKAQYLSEFNFSAKNLRPYPIIIISL